MAPNRSRSSFRMPPQVASRSSLRSLAPSAAAAAAALKTLGEQLKLAKKNRKEIKIPDDILDPVNEILRPRRGNDTPSQPLFVAGIISNLDDNRDDVCSCLEVKVYNTLLRLFLQTTDCPEVERGLYLLAATLFDDAHFTARDKVVTAKKIAIGEDSLQPLLNFFTNITYPAPLRRWTGILLLQLLQDSEKNIERVVLSSNDNRCKLGNMVLTESNEVVKIICGQLIKELVDAGVAKGDLWPEDTNNQVYEGFPDSSRPGRWNQRFQTYLDDLDHLDEVDTPGNWDAILYFAQDIDTIPPYNLERLGHTTYVAMNVDNLSIWSPASDTQFDQFLEIPLQHITRIAISTTADSQPTDVARVVLYIETDGEQFCSLNGAGIDLNQAFMHLYTNEAISFREDLFNHRPEIDDRSSQEAGYDARTLEWQNSIHSSSSNEAIILQVASQQPARFESAVERSAKGNMETKKKVEQTIDTDADFQLGGSEVGVDNLKSSESLMKGNNVMLQSKDTTKKRGVAEAKPNAKKPLSMSQKVRSGRKTPPSIGTKDRTESEKTKPQLKSDDDSPQHTELAGQTFEQKVEKLCQGFPAESSSTIRAVLVVSDGDLEAATETLRKGIQSDISSDEKCSSEAKGQSSSRLDKAEEQFDSASFTSPDGNDASTPKFNKPTAGQKITMAIAIKSTAKTADTTQKTNKNPAPGKTIANPKSAVPKLPKYYLRAKQPLGIARPKVTLPKSQEKPKTQTKQNPTNAASSKCQENAKAPTQPSAKSQAKLKAASSDLYELLEDEDDENAAVTSKKGAKGGTKATTKGPAKKAPTAAKTAPKTAKRQSAPAALETTAAITRSRRNAAVVASQKLRNSNTSEDEIEDEELVDAKKSQSSRPGRGTASQKNLQPIPKVKLREQKSVPAASPHNQEDSLNIEVNLGPLHHDPESEPDLYNASPKPHTKKPTREPVRERTQNPIGAFKTVPQTRQNFSSKLEDILGDIDDELIPKYNRVAVKNSDGETLSATLQNCGSGQRCDLREKKQMSESMSNKDVRHPSQADLGKSEDQKLDKTALQADCVRGLADNNKAGSVYGCRPSRRGPSPPPPVVKDELVSLARELLPGTAEEPLHTYETDTELTSVGQDSSADEALINNEMVEQVGSAAKRTRINDLVNGLSGDSVPKVPVIGKKTASNNLKKRKGISEAETPPKRKRSQGDAIQANEDQYLRQSPCLKARVEEKQRAAKQRSRKIERKAPSSPTRRSPRLEARVAAATEIPDNILSDKPLIDDHLTRKVHIVNFGAQGAKNQGPSSVLRNSAQKNTIRPSEQRAALADSPVPKKSKRARDDELNESKPGQPSKRQSISPEESQEDLPIDVGNLQEYLSSPPPRQRQKARPSKTSSQASRVDYNGSPRPLVNTQKIDHFSKVTQKLLQQQQEDENARAPNSNVIFGPRFRLVSILKTGPSSPLGVEARYVKHQKMGSGIYKGIESKKVVAPEKSLADPFVGGPAHQPSGFADKLQAGTSKENRKPEAVHQPKKGNQVPVDAMEPNVANKVSIQKTSKATKQEQNSHLPNKTDRMPIYDDQATLVNSEPSLTWGSSEDDTKIPLSEKEANDARHIPLRPHYESLSAVAYRLADEVIIRLANEEDVMGLLLRQYEDNGGKHFNMMIETRDKEKSQIANNLNQQKKEMVAVYGAAKTFVNDSEKTIKSSSLIKFEKQWRNEQEDIQRRIEEGRRILQ